MIADSSLPKNTEEKEINNAAEEASKIVEDILGRLPAAEQYDYSGHILKIGEYDVCSRCSQPIAEAQAAQKAIALRAESTENPTIKEHLEAAAELMKHEAKAAEIRAELHNGQNSEPILNSLLAFLHDRQIYDEYDHSHNGN